MYNWIKTHMLLEELFFIYNRKAFLKNESISNDVHCYRLYAGKLLLNGRKKRKNERKTHKKRLCWTILVLSIVAFSFSWKSFEESYKRSIRSCFCFIDICCSWRESRLRACCAFNFSRYSAADISKKIQIKFSLKQSKSSRTQFKWSIRAISWRWLRWTMTWIFRRRWIANRCKFFPFLFINQWRRWSELVFMIRCTRYRRRTINLYYII